MPDAVCICPQLLIVTQIFICSYALWSYYDVLKMSYQNIIMFDYRTLRVCVEGGAVIDSSALLCYKSRLTNKWRFQIVCSQLSKFLLAT
jgi:hypothetical protein